jgi:hypothetical protein
MTDKNLVARLIECWNTGKLDAANVYSVSATSVGDDVTLAGARCRRRSASTISGTTSVA